MGRPRAAAAQTDAAARARRVGPAPRAGCCDGWGFDARTARGLGTTALFAGPSGTGKTLAAEVVAGDLDFDLVQIDLSQVVSKYIGETEKQLRRVFDAAEDGGAVLLFDEADTLFGRRSEVRDSHDRYANLEVGYLLQRMESFRGLAILTTNARGGAGPGLHPAAAHHRHVPVPGCRRCESVCGSSAFPDRDPGARTRPAAARRARPARRRDRAVALTAAYLAAADGGVVRQEHVRTAARWELAKSGRSATTSGGFPWPIARTAASHARPQRKSAASAVGAMPTSERRTRSRPASPAVKSQPLPHAGSGCSAQTRSSGQRISTPAEVESVLAAGRRIRSIRASGRSWSGGLGHDLGHVRSTPAHRRRRPRDPSALSPSRPGPMSCWAPASPGLSHRAEAAAFSRTSSPTSSRRAPARRTTTLRRSVESPRRAEMVDDAQAAQVTEPGPDRGHPAGESVISFRRRNGSIDRLARIRRVAEGQPDEEMGTPRRRVPRRHREARRSRPRRSAERAAERRTRS